MMGTPSAAKGTRRVFFIVMDLPPVASGKKSTTPLYYVWGMASPIPSTAVRLCVRLCDFPWAISPVRFLRAIRPPDQWCGGSGRVVQRKRRVHALHGTSMKVPMSEKDQDFASMLAEFEQRNPAGIVRSRRWGTAFAAA
jgi:hypothetical protein